MGWIQVDDLSGEVIPAGHMHLLTLTLDDDQVWGWEIKVREDLETLLADLGEHLVRQSGRAGETVPLEDGFVAPPRPAPLDYDRIRQLVHLELATLAEELASGASEYADESADDEPGTVHGGGSSQVNGSAPVDESAENDIRPDVATPAVDVTTRIGEATGGRASDATIRAWAVHHGVPASTTGGLKKWVRQSYERVHGGAPDEQTWLDARADPGTWVDADGRLRSRQNRTQTPTPSSAGAEGDPAPDPDPRPGSAPATAHTETPETAGRHSEEPPTSDPCPPAGRAPATHTPDGALGSGTGGTGAPVPDPAPTGRAPEAASADVRPVGDGGKTAALDQAHELAADGTTPMTIVDRTGISLAEAREVVNEARKVRR